MPESFLHSSEQITIASNTVCNSPDHRRSATSRVLRWANRDCSKIDPKIEIKQPNGVRTGSEAESPNFSHSELMLHVILIQICAHHGAPEPLPTHLRTATRRAVAGLWQRHLSQSLVPQVAQLSTAQHHLPGYHQKLGVLILKVFVGPLWKPCLSHSQLLLWLTTCPIPGCLRFLQEMPNGLRLETGCANWTAPLSTLLPQLEISIYVQSSFVTPSTGNICKNIGAQESTPLFQLSCYIPQRNKFYGNDKHNSKCHWILVLAASSSYKPAFSLTCNEQCNWQSHLRLKD